MSIPQSAQVIFRHIHPCPSHAGLDFHRKIFLVNDNLFNQPPDHRLVVFGRGDGLLPQKSSHIGNTFFQFIPPGTFQLKRSYGCGNVPNVKGFALKPAREYMGYNNKTGKSDIPTLIIIGKRKPHLVVQSTSQRH